VPDTVAVNVTNWPNVEGFMDETSAVVVGMGLTTCDTAVDIVEPNTVSPLYRAVIEWGPGSRVEIVTDAVLPISVTGDPSTVLPSREGLASRNVTVPVGVPPAPNTVAVNVTG
jgi:hypothetical protein